MTVPFNASDIYELGVVGRGPIRGKVGSWRTLPDGRYGLLMNVREDGDGELRRIRLIVTIEPDGTMTGEFPPDPATDLELTELVGSHTIQIGVQKTIRILAEAVLARAGRS